MPLKRKATSEDTSVSLVLSADNLRKLTDLMDELAFRGPMQEALIMRVANCGGFDDVITRIKRRRLYKKRMSDGAAAFDERESESTSKPRGKKKGKKSARPTNRVESGNQPEAGTGGE